MALYKCANCGTEIKNSKKFKTYCSKSCSNKDRVHEIKPRLDYKLIYKLSDEGVKRIEIANAVGCSINSVHRVLRERGRKNGKGRSSQTL